VGIRDEGLEKAVLDALSAVDALEAHRAKAKKLGTLTAQGVASDTLQFAASKLAPQLQKGKRLVEQARNELTAKREKLTAQAGRQE
jgi:hypothetical protein